MRFQSDCRSGVPTAWSVVKLGRGQPAMRVDVSEILLDRVGARLDLEVDEGGHQLSADVSVSSLEGTLEFWRTTEGIWVRGRLAAGVDLQCVRCLASCDHVVEIELDEQFRFPPIPDRSALGLWQRRLFCRQRLPLCARHDHHRHGVHYLSLQQYADLAHQPHHPANAGPAASRGWHHPHS